MSLPWFRIDIDVVDHPKVHHLETLLGPCAGWYLLRLWAWTARYASRGRLTMLARASLERSCGWVGEPGKLTSALLEAGLLDEAGNGELEVHDWWEKQGAIVEKAEKDRERQRIAREARGIVPRQSSDARGIVPRQSSDARGVVAGDETGRDETRQGETPSVPQPPLELLPDQPRPKRAPKPPDPEAEFARFKAACTPDELRVFEAFCVAFAVDLAPDWSLQKFVRLKLKAHTADELCAAVRGAGRDPWYREKPHSLRGLLSDASKVAQLAKRGAA